MGFPGRSSRNDWVGAGGRLCPSRGLPAVKELGPTGGVGIDEGIGCAGGGSLELY